MTDILQKIGGNWPELTRIEPLPTGEGVLDTGAFNTIEVDELFDTVNKTQTQAGETVLYRSLARPLDNLEQIQQKQEALREIQNNPGVRENLENIVSQAAQREKHLYLLLFGEFLGSMGTAREDHQIEGYGYKQYRNGVRFAENLVQAIYTSGEPSSAYLKDIFAKITHFADSRCYQLMQGPVYNTEKGFQTKTERKGSWVPATIFRPRVFKPLLITMVFLFLWAGMQLIPDGFVSTSRGTVALWGIFLVPLSLIYFPVIGSYDRDNCIIPLRDEFKESEELAGALEALGQLDELLALLKYAEQYPSDKVLPEMFDNPHHSIHLTEAKNPVLGFDNPDYVGNDFDLEQEKLIFITGPNSGGKTALCKTVTQIQLLAQIGSFVPARTARLSVADHIFYQAPEISHLDDGEGRYGTELKRTKAIFLASTAQSLVVLDEMSEGTTFEEKMESSTHVLDGFYRKGNNTILITHNHQLVDVFMQRKEGVARQVEFANELPTYKLIDGISRVSHADRVAKKIGFSKEDIDKYLAEDK